MPTLHVVRHGEPALKGVLLGRTDPILSPAGKAQCAAVRIEANLFYTSPLRRTRQSAEILARGRPMIVLPDLIEISLGLWDGRLWTEIEQEFPEIAAAKLADWTGVTPPGGEPWADFTRRIDRALDVILAGHLPAVIVGHLAVNACIAHRLGSAEIVSFTQQYAEILTYEI